MKAIFKKFLLFVLLAWTSVFTFQVEIEAREIAPPDVFARVSEVREDIDLIRRAMGRLKENKTLVKIKGAAPREVFFQALTLYRKTSQVYFELFRKRTSKPTIPTGEIRPANVFAVVADASKLLGDIKSKLGIVSLSLEPEPDPKKTPTDVYRSILQANRQLNLLLE